MTSINLDSALIEDWILREMAAFGIVTSDPGGYTFHGDRNDFSIEVKALPIRKTVRLQEPVYDFGPDYDEQGRGYN